MASKCAAPKDARGEVVRKGRRGPQIVTNGGTRWSAKAERTFLEWLAASCNITRAAHEAGFVKSVVYQRRMNWPGFAERWDQALAQGYARLEMALVEAANDTLGDVAFDPDRPIPKMTVKEALNVLKLHRASIKGGDLPGFRWRLKPADPAAARANILAKVAAVRRARARSGSAS